SANTPSTSGHSTTTTTRTPTAIPHPSARCKTDQGPVAISRGLVAIPATRQVAHTDSCRVAGVDDPERHHVSYNANSAALSLCAGRTDVKSARRSGILTDGRFFVSLRGRAPRLSTPSPRLTRSV